MCVSLRLCVRGERERERGKRRNSSLEGRGPQKYALVLYLHCFFSYFNFLDFSSIFFVPFWFTSPIFGSFVGVFLFFYKDGVLLLWVFLYWLFLFLFYFHILF